MTNDNIANHDPSASTKGRKTLASQVASKITDYIDENNMKPGDRIPSEYELAALFGVGRGTVREAVKQLVGFNLLTIVPAKGTFVSDVMDLSEKQFEILHLEDRKEVFRGLFELRVTIECFAVRKAAVNISDSCLATLKSLCEQLEACTDNARCLELDIEFHKNIAEGSGNVVLPILSPVLHSSYFHFFDLNYIRDWEKIAQEHRKIIKAIENKDGFLAEIEIIKHLSIIHEYVESLKE